MATYYGMTSLGTDWRMLVVGNDRQAVADAAEKLILRGQRQVNPSDIFQQTELRNLRVFTRTDLRRKLHWSEDTIFERQYEALLPESVDDHLASLGVDRD